MEKTKTNQMTLNILGHVFTISTGTMLDENNLLSFNVAIDNGKPENFHKTEIFAFDILRGEKQPKNMVLEMRDYKRLLCVIFSDAIEASYYTNVFDFMLKWKEWGEQTTRKEVDEYIQCEHALNILKKYFDNETITALEEEIMKELSPLDDETTRKVEDEFLKRIAMLDK